MDPRILNQSNDIIMATSILIEEGSFPYRIVLREKKDHYVVHRETLRGCVGEIDMFDITGTGCLFRHEAFFNGKYFNFAHNDITHLPTKEEAYKKAVDCFHEQAKNIRG